LKVNKWNTRRASLLRVRLENLFNPPLLTIVMPVYNPPLEFLNRAIQSVADQVYENWELCIADDASSDPEVKPFLERWAEQDPRIRLVFREENGHISLATNSAARIARGEYLIFLDQDDEITPDALGEIAHFLVEHPETEILYSDDDKIDAEGRRYAPQFKPDWSPELLLSYMYLSHLFVIRKDLFEKSDGLRVGFEGSQDYDLALRSTEVAGKIEHIPKVLYHWRALPTSTAFSGSAKPDSFRAGIKAVQEALDRRHVSAEVYQPEWALRAGCGIFAHRFADTGPRVAIIIPTKNNVAVLEACLQSIRKTTYKNYEVVIIDNESDDPKTIDFLQQVPVRVLRIPNPEGRFNFAWINNRAVERIDAEYVLFLNDDTEVKSPAWLSQMVGYLGMPGVGAVGARLLFPDRRVQHAGVVHGYYNGMAGPAFKLLPEYDFGYLSYAKVTRNYAAVTAACMLTRRDLFLQLGGFDEDDFSVAFNDVDYCYRLRAAGHRIVYCATSELVHHEGFSRGFTDNPAEPAAFKRKYGERVDPYYNPNLSLNDERFSINPRTMPPASIGPIRSLMCAFTLNWEGAPYSQYEMTVRLKEKGIIDPIVYSPIDGPLRQAYERHGIEVRVSKHPMAGARNLAGYLDAIENLTRLFKDLDIGLVYGNTLQTFYAIDAAKLARIPSIWNPRESEPWQSYFNFLPPAIATRALECFAYPYKVIFVANATRDAWLPLNSQHNFMTIHNGLNRERFAGALRAWPRDAARRQLNVSPDEIMILSIGTVCERKGQIDLVKAVGGLSEKQAARVRCFIVGDRACRYSDRLAAARHRLPSSKRSRVEIVPETPDTNLYYSAADLFICTSRIESFPRVILEAMAADLPIITTPVFGIAEQVEENVNALFYQPGDTRGLADKIARFLEEPDLGDDLRRNTRFVLDKLIDFESMVSAYGRVFQEAWLSGDGQ
jgi:GT2 family glycosyltransferase/glycosyltransferase involved in cell wall biosynthesis